MEAIALVAFIVLIALVVGDVTTFRGGTRDKLVILGKLILLVIIGSLLGDRLGIRKFFEDLF